MNNIYSFEATLNDGSRKALKDFSGEVLLIVNTASQCGFTPQYSELQTLHEKYRDRGFHVLAFPCNQFGAQEKGSDQEIKNFCETQFHINFPLFQKIEVNGYNAHPLYSFLKSSLPGILGSQAIKWNFTKFLIDRQGNPVERFGPQVKPTKIIPSIEKLLG
ncbi:MAG: glutathione peroxidase [Halobacteriovoraceae bacterium]|nr:glutathione peroxidase [Halobacteriovoraceae bacterium]MCB9093790.1 glutathione peroxidase [Halobacteriovoraceae bacterium]